MSCLNNQLKVLRKTSIVKIIIILKNKSKRNRARQTKCKIIQKYEKISIFSVVLTKIYTINEKR